MNAQRLVAVILALFILLGSTYALVTPVFEASDELWHYPMVQHLADGNPLPVQVFDPAAAGPWKQEASQPPLYYYLGAALTWWIDTSDMQAVRRLNPHVDNGVITVDGNINLAVHDPAANLWGGTHLAVRIVRLASVLMGAVTVLLTYHIARAVAPSRPEIAVGAAAVNAFTPMFLFISGAVNNDNLAIMLSSLALLLLIQMVGRRYTGGRAESGRVLLVGLVIGLAALTKESTLALIPLAWGTFFVRAWQVESGRAMGDDAPQSTTPLPISHYLRRVLPVSLLNLLLALLPVLLVAGWWYYRNVVLYGDWLGWNAFIAVLGERPQPASLAQLWDERHGFLMSYWGLFGGVNVPMWPPIYWILNGVLLAGVLGFGVYLSQQARPATVHLLSQAPAVPRSLPHLLVDVLQLVLRYFPLVICLLFAAGVVYGLINWATTTWSSQGRLVFTAISALTVLLVVGLAGWLPSRVARLLLAALGLFMFVVAAAAPFSWIRPAYQPTAYHPPRPYVLRPVRVDFGESLRLTGYALDPQTPGTVTRPGEFVDVVLSWEVLQPMDRDWSVFVHLNDPVLEAPAVQRDMYHGQGLRPTSLLQPGEEVISYYRLHLPATILAPSELDLVVGLYDFTTGERLAQGNGLDAAHLAVLQVQPAPGDYPNPLAVNFGDEIELLGYSVEPRLARPGTPLTLTLYWQPLEGLKGDYTFFAQVLDEDTTRWAAADVAPEGGTSSYPAGSVQTLSLSLEVDSNAPADVYPLVVGLYQRGADGSFWRLQVVEEGRITMADSLTLTRIRIE